LPELQDLVHKNIFTQDEIRQIIKKRTEHEHILLRRTAKKVDYLRYINYEINLETLRQKRAKRIKSIAPLVSSLTRPRKEEYLGLCWTEENTGLIRESDEEVPGYEFVAAVHRL